MSATFLSKKNQPHPLRSNPTHPMSFASPPRTSEAAINCIEHTSTAIRKSFLQARTLNISRSNLTKSSIDALTKKRLSTIYERGLTRSGAVNKKHVPGVVPTVKDADWQKKKRQGQFLTTSKSFESILVVTDLVRRGALRGWKGRKPSTT